MGLNKAIIMGRLTADPELKRTQGCVSVTNFGVAVERNHKSGEQREVDYLDVVAWRGRRYSHTAHPPAQMGGYIRDLGVSGSECASAARSEANAKFAAGNQD